MRIDYTNGYYEGKTLDDKKYGYGVFVWDDGSYYSGCFEDEYNVSGVVYIDVKGKMFFGEIIEGDFLNFKI